MLYIVSPTVSVVCKIQLIQQKEELKMFEEFQEAAEKEEQRKKIKYVINVTTGVLIFVTLVLLTFYIN